MNTFNTEIDEVRRRSPVNAGLLYAANELERAQYDKERADKRYVLALADFIRRYYGAT